MNIDKVNIKKLIMSDYNPRKDLQPGDIEYEKLKMSIKQFGYVEPIIWNKQTGNVVGGHQRLKILIELGETEIDCVIVDLDLSKEKALNIALNKISGDWDIPLLSDLLKDLETSGFDLQFTGFDAKDIQDIFNATVEVEAKEDDEFDLSESLDEIVEPITRYGDVWQIGNHRLMCGDATNFVDVSKLMTENKADLIVTDPPYNVNYKGKAKTRSEIKNDNLDEISFEVFLANSFKCMSEVIKDGGSYYVFCASYSEVNFKNSLISTGLMLKQTLIWEKNTFVMGRQDYQWKHEPILYGWKEGAAHNWYSDRKQTTILNFDKPTKSEEHPTMKPIKLLAYLINNSSKVDDNIIDFFAGSGSTLIAAQQLKRNCFLMELEPKYCDVIIKRFINFFQSQDDIFLFRDGIKINYRDIALI